MLVSRRTTAATRAFEGTVCLLRGWETEEGDGVQDQPGAICFKGQGRRKKGRDVAFDRLRVSPSSTTIDAQRCQVSSISIRTTYRSVDRAEHPSPASCRGSRKHGSGLQERDERGEDGPRAMDAECHGSPGALAPPVEVC
jgi:hypothetical protein